ncbi:hypothetical protein GCM10022215_36580 [Nocardioides fonticola]|uniref:Uncharacterized protein n=1 Tax=Nocardioides fonticola TaxID=450363 RepID=A0ABP7XWE8_9ACTN
MTASERRRRDGSVDYTHLPAAVDPDDVIATHDPDPVPDAGPRRDPDLEAFIRYGF